MIGSNHNGQLGLPKETAFLKEFKKIETYEQKPQKIYSFGDIGAYINDDREFYLWGLIIPGGGDGKGKSIIYQNKLF